MARRGRSRRSTQRSRNRARARARAQSAARSRRAARKTISSVKSANRSRMQRKAAERHKKFKQTRVQTFGGRKTSFSNAEKRRIEKAGYKVEGYSKAPAQSNTQLQINKDNQMYGNTVPAGSFGISEAGRIQAEKNRAEAAAKAAAAKKAAEAAAKKEATRKSTFNPNRISSTFNMNWDSSPFTGLKGLESFRNTGYRAPVYKPGNQMRFGIPYNDPGRTGTLGNFGNWFDKGVNKRIGNEARIGFGTAFADDVSQMGKFKNLKTGRLETGLFGTGIPKNWNQLKQTFQGEGGFGFSFGKGADTGPTGIQRMAVRRILPYANQIGIGRDIWNQGRADSATTNLMNNINTGVANLTGGRLNSPGNNPETDIGARAWRGITSIPGRVSNLLSGDDTKVASAGGLNIGGGVDSGEATSNTGRTVVSTDRDKNIGYDIGGIAKDVGLGLADWATGNKFDFDNLGRPSDDKTFTQRFETFKKSPLQQAIISKQTGIDAKRLINEGDAAAKSLFKNYIGDIDASTKKGVRQPIARFLKDVGSDDATAMAGRAIDAYGYDDPNFSDTPNKLTKMLKSAGLPQLSQENVQDLRHTFNKTVTTPSEIQGKSILKNVPYNQALGLANRIVSGKLSDATGEAMNQLGMGNVGGIDDAINLGMRINTNRQTKDTLANKRFGELDNLIQKYGPGKGQIPTIPSIIRGIGGAVGRSGGSGNPIQIQGGGGMTATLPLNQQLPQEVLPLPTTATQTGTDSGNLASITQNAYNNQMSLYNMNPNYFAQFRQPRFNTRPRRFRQVFNRGYF